MEKLIIYGNLEQTNTLELLKAINVRELKAIIKTHVYPRVEIEVVANGGGTLSQKARLHELESYSIRKNLTQYSRFGEYLAIKGE